MLKLCKRFLAVIVLALLIVTMVGCNKPEPEVVKRLDLSNATLALTVGDEKALTAKYYENDVEVTATIGYKSSDLAVATLNGNTVKAVSAGNAVVTAYVVGHDEVKAQCEVSVQAKIVEPPVVVKHALTIELDGGVYENAPTEFVEGEALRLAAPTKEGYRFLGYQKAEGEALVMALTGEDKADVTLTAKWEKIDERVPLTTSFNATAINDLIALVPNASDATKEKYYAIGYVVEVENTKYGNIYIEDADGNKLYVYGVYDQDGVNRYENMTIKPVVGDIVVLYGIMSNHGGTIEMKNAYLVQYNGYVFEHASTERSVTLILGDGKVEKDVTSYTIGTAVELPTPTKDGYKFLGWYNGETKVTGITAKDKANLVLVAKWEKIVLKEYAVKSELNGGKLEAKIEVNPGTQPIVSWGVVKAGYSYAAIDATLAYVCKLSDLVGINGLRYQNKAYLKYNAAYKAWEIILVDNATASSATLGMNGVAEYVIGGTTDKTVQAICKDKSYEGKFIVFDQDITTLAKGDCAVVASVYKKTDFVDSSKVVETIEEGSEVALPTPTKAGYNFLGWFEGETKVEKLVGNKDYNIEAKFEKIINKHAVTINLTEGTLPAYKAVDGEAIAKLHITKFNGKYANDAEEVYIAEIKNDKAEGANTLRWQYKIVLAYDKAVGAYKIVGVDAGTKTLADMGVQGEYVIATLKDEVVINLSANEELVGKYVVINRDLAKISVSEVDMYATIAEGTQVVEGAQITEYIEGDVLVLPTPVREGYWRFVGWTDGKDTFTAIPAEKLADVTLTPVWEEIIIKHYITWDLDGAVLEDLPEYFIEGKENILLPTPTKKDYEFLGWEIDGVPATEIDCKGTKDITIVASWFKPGEKEVFYNLTLELDGGELATTPTQYQLGKGLALPTPTKQYFDFAGWYKGDTLVQKITKLQTGDLTLTAHWTRRTHSISYNLDGGTNAEANTATYEEGIGLTFADPTKAHFTFLGWFVGTEEITSIGTDATEDVEITAKWQRITHAISYSVTGGTYDSATAPTSYDEGVGLKKLPVVTSTVDWKVFDGWYVGETKVTAISDADTTDFALVAKYVDGMVMIGKTTYLNINKAMEAAKDNDVLVLAAGEHLLTTTSTKAVTIEGPNKGIPYNGTRSKEATIFVNQSTDDNYRLKNAYIVFDGVEISSKYNNTSLFYAEDTCLHAEFNNVLIDSKYTGSGYKLNSFFRLNYHTGAGMEIYFNNTSIQDIDQFVLNIYGSNKTIAKFNHCEVVNCQGRVGAQLFRIQKNSPESEIALFDCKVEKPGNCLVKVESGLFNMTYCHLIDFDDSKYFRQTQSCYGSYNSNHNYWENSSFTYTYPSYVTATNYSTLEALQTALKTKELIIDLAGGTYYDGYELKSTATSKNSVTLTKFGGSYSTYATVPYICVSSTCPNGLTYQQKLCIKYNAAYNAYEIVCINKANKSLADLGMKTGSDYTIAMSNYSGDFKTLLDNAAVGDFIVFDTDLSTLSGNNTDINVSATVYAKDQYQLKAVAAPTTYVEGEDVKLGVAGKDGEIFLGWLYKGNIIKSLKECSGDAYITAQFAKHVIDWSDATLDKQFVSSKWVQQIYNNGWQNTSGQMNCRTSPDGMKVVNMTSGYSMTYTYTYNPGASMGLINKIQFYVGNYKNSPEEFQIKVVLIDKDGKPKYVYGDSSNFAKVPVTTGMIPFELTFDEYEVSQFKVVVKSTKKAYAYLYFGPIAFEHTSVVKQAFTAKSYSGNQSYSDAWFYGPTKVIGGHNNSTSETNKWSYIRFGGKAATLATNSTAFIELGYALNENASKVVINLSSKSETYNSDSKKASIHIEVYSDENYMHLVSKTEAKLAPANKSGSTASLEFDCNIPKGTYVKVVLDITNTTTSNGVINIDNIEIK